MMTRHNSISGLILIGSLSFFVPIAIARPLQLWSMEELNAQADVVLVGIAFATDDAKGYSYKNAVANTWVNVDTVFQVETVLKGKLDAKTVAVRHERYFGKEAETAVIDGPAFIAFAVEQKQRFLIFLKRSEDGTLEPLSGQYDPAFSFFRIDDVR